MRQHIFTELCMHAVVPFVHSGMDAVVPRGSALPRPGRSVRLLVGDPIPVADLMRAAEEQAWPNDRLYIAIADRVGTHLHALKARLEDAPLSQVRQPANIYSPARDLLGKFFCQGCAPNWWLSRKGMEIRPMEGVRISQVALQ